MNKKVRKLHIVSLILLIILIVSSCQAPRRPGPNLGTENRDISGEHRTPQERIGAEMNQEIIKSEAAADALVDLTGVDDATVVFWGDRALVGVITPGGTISEELRKEMIKRVKNSNPTINEVDITTDKETFVELDDAQQSLIRGEKINNISKDIENISKKIKNTK